MEHLGWGLQMTVLGMGLVFTLLAILWALLKLVLVLDKGDEEEAPQATPQAPAEAAQSAVAEEAQAPAIRTSPGGGDHDLRHETQIDPAWGGRAHHAYRPTR